MSLAALGIHRWSRWSWYSVVVAASLSATSCESTIGGDSEPVDRIALSPTTGSVQVGGAITLAAQVLDAAGNPMRDRKIVWSSEDPRIATVNESGVVVGVAAGSVLIAASSGGKSASAAISVSSRPVTLVRLTPASGTIAVGNTGTLTAEAFDAAGDPANGLPVTWKSSNESVATVNNAGAVTGVVTGAVTITATISGRDGTAAITIVPQPVAAVRVTPTSATIFVGGRVTLSATAVDAQNNPLANRIVFWSSDNSIAATVTSEGEVIGFAAGSARIRATVEGKSADASILVQQVPVARVVVSPNQLTMNPGQTSQLSVTLNDGAGNVLQGRTVTYTSSDPAIATVNGSGLVTAVAQGTAQIDVASEGEKGSVAVTVNPVPIASITIVPNVFALRVTQTTTLTAEARDAQGQLLTNRTFSWSSSAPSVATVDQSGLVTAVAVGTATINATSEGRTGSATINVAPEPVNSVTLTARRTYVVPGDTMHLTVVLRDAQNNVLTGRIVVYAATPAGLVTVDAAGVVTGISSSGTSAVTATSEGKSATIQIASVAAVASITATGPTNSALDLMIPPGTTKRFTVTIRDGTGNPVPGQTVSATTSDANLLTLSSGTLTSDAQGNATVDITASGLLGTASVTFGVTRAGAIPPATPGTNNLSMSLAIVVP